MKRLTQTQSHTHFISRIKSLIYQKHYSRALKSSLLTLSPCLTDQIYVLFIKSGHPLHPHLSTTLISHFSKYPTTHNLSRSLNFLLDTNNPDTITYNSLISGFARGALPGRVFRLFNELRQLGLVPDVFTLSSLIKGCGDSSENWVAHGVCVSLGLKTQAFVVSGLIENYAKNGDVVSAERCFEECFRVDNVVYTAMVCGYVWNGEFRKGKEVFVQMRGLGLDLNEFSLSGVIGGLFNLREGEQIHGFGVKLGLLCGGSMHLSNAVMSMYARCGSKVDAVKVFDEIPNPDVVSWTERIGAACDSEEALGFFRIFHSLGLDFNEYTLINVLSAIGRVKLLKAGGQIHALCHKTGYLQVVSIGNALISMYGSCGQMNDARHVFYAINYRDCVTWNCLIAACSENGFASEALEVFSHMRDLSLQPTIFTLISILEAVSNLNCLKQTMQIHSHLIKCGFMSDDSVVSILILAYGRSNRMDESKTVFTEIDEVNLVHVNAMMTNLVQSGCHSNALFFFLTTWRSCLEVDGRTFSTALKACGAMTDMEQGRAIHALLLKSGFEQDSFVESALIDIYCKCGSIRDAEKAFRSMSIENLAAWNAMMMGYAQHGCHQEVFKIFNEMSEFEVEPDEITYLGVLTSCCHAGLVKEAYYYLKSMFKLHGIIPHLEHYACVVDLLGRVGLLQDAKEIMDHMPIQPDAHLWQILLSGCSIHRNVELGRVAASELRVLQPENESAYILLSNLYASSGMWNAAGKLRKEMKEKELHKEPGSSWIQVGGSIHNFLVRDIFHPQNNEIYMELKRLYGQMFTLAELE